MLKRSPLISPGLRERPVRSRPPWQTTNPRPGQACRQRHCSQPRLLLVGPPPLRAHQDALPSHTVHVRIPLLQEEKRAEQACWTWGATSKGSPHRQWWPVPWSGVLGCCCGWWWFLWLCGLCKVFKYVGIYISLLWCRMALSALSLSSRITQSLMISRCQRCSKCFWAQFLPLNTIFLFKICR